MDFKYDRKGQLKAIINKLERDDRQFKIRNITPQAWSGREHFFHNVIDDLERIEYNPYNLLQPNAYMAIYELNKHRTVGKI